MVTETDDEVTVTPSTSEQRTLIGVTDKNFDEVIGDWMELNDNLSDCDMDTENEDYFFPVMTSRNATAEPATDTDMTLYEARVLETEDRRNDLAIRAIAPHDYYNFEWKRDKQTFIGRRENFTGTPGATFSITDQTSVVEIFYKMIDTDFIDRICTETNRYADQKIKLLKGQKEFVPTLRLHQWTPTDRDEMVSFLAITILQGIYPLPKEESYFSFNGFATMPYFRKIMSYNRFLLLKSLIHFVDNETITEPNKLCKIQMVTDYFNEKFSHLYYPSQEVVIDESLLKWHGRLGFAQKISSKAAQVGVKTYELCEASSGYLWKFLIYAGKEKTGTAPATATSDETNPTDTDERPDDTDTTEHVITGSSDVRPSNATAKIVYDLVEPLLHRGHTLIMDNFYNSPLLARCLKRQQTDSFGTLRLSREFVPDSLKTITKTQLRQGEVLASYCSDLSVIVWRDANLVSMLSTYHALQIGTRQKYDRLTYKPKVVLDYNKCMGGVDRKDQFLSAQPMERVRNKIWYKKVFRRLFNCAIFNCFILFKTANPNVSHRQFRTTLAEDLLKLHRHIDLTTEPRLVNLRTGLTKRSKTTTTSRPKVEHRHFPIKTGFKQSRCWLCARRKVAARTIWKCLECDKNLCINGCFIEYHT
ncbi:unnamed protein product [Parnassius mnemosyne]